MKYDYKSVEVLLDLLKSGELTYVDGEFYRNGRQIKKQKTGKGSYFTVEVKIKSVRYRSFIHRLLFAWHHSIDELKKYETIDHINGDKYDNRIENLQGMSNFDNAMKSRHGKLTVKDGVEIKKLLDEGVPGSKIARRFGVSNTTISKIKRGLRFKYI